MNQEVLSLSGFILHPSSFRGEMIMVEKSRRERIEEMLAADPQDAFLRYGLAMEHLGAGQLEEAARCFADLRRINPDYVPGYLQAGKVLRDLGRDDEARSVWHEGITAARRQGDSHAAGEMEAFLEGMD
jgi:tetratricopeptide (TPR) repeat protein